MTSLLYVGPEFIYHPLSFGILALLLVGGGMRFAFQRGRTTAPGSPARSPAVRACGILLGVALILIGALIFLAGLLAWAFDGYEEDAGTGTTRSLFFGLVLFGLGIAVIAAGAATVRAVRRGPTTPPRGE